jgi:hypothetical protein
MTISSTAVNPTPLDVDGLVFITNQEILSFFDPKSRPAITVSDSNASISCKISGDLVPVR